MINDMSLVQMDWPGSCIYTCLHMAMHMMDICDMPWCTDSMAGVDRHPVCVNEGSLPQAAAAGSPGLTGHP